MAAVGFTPTQPHPVLQLPTAEQADAMGADRWINAMKLREKTIATERATPLWHCWEPPIWKVCDALWGAPWLDEEEARKIRENLKFMHPVNVLMLNGGWASSKSEYAANRVSRLMQRQPNGITWYFHETVSAQIDQQEPLIYKYLPPNLKGDKNIMTRTTYITYKEKTGFSERSFVLPNSHRARGWTYEGGVDKLQGPTVSNAWGDELMTPEFQSAIRSRVSRSGGVFFITFAPIHGYSEMVQEFWDGAEIVRESIAFLNPDDGGPRDVARYLGLGETELEPLRVFMNRKQKPPFPNVPFSRPEDCAKWVTGESSQPEVPVGRKFKKVPRVLKPLDPEQRSAVVCFHGSDNPYGNPLSVYMINAGAAEELGNRYFYGYAKKGMVRKFPKFDRKVHVIPDEAVPAFGKNYHFGDPADARNFFMNWIRVTPKAAYLYREWPGNYEIPEIGVPGPWAIPSGKLGDGAPGPSQESFGFGLVDYKAEIARLEQWKDALTPTEPGAKEESKADRVKKWYAENGTKEAVDRRFLDSRFASSPHMENDRPVTLIENFADIGMFFETTPGDEIAEGVQGINDLLAYDTTKPIDSFNCPKLYIAASCRNTIFALETWRNKEGKKGATKDPIDLLRYFVLSGVNHFIPDEAYESTGGGHY